MNIKINLECGKMARIDGQDKIVLPETSSEITFDSRTYAIDDLIVIAKNGKKEIKKRVTDKRVDISELLFEGMIEMTVHLVARSECVKSWGVVPIIVQEADGGYYIFDAIEDHEHRLVLLEEKTKITM